MPRRVLLIEPSDDDAARIGAMISTSPGGSALAERVLNIEEAAAALAGESWDAVICEESLFAEWGNPVSTGHLPPIFVCGAGEEEAAVRAIKRGAVDYFCKRRLDRLAIVLEREIGESTGCHGGAPADGSTRARVEALETMLGEERKLTGENLDLRELRNFRQREALVALASAKPDPGEDLAAALRRITEATARALEVGRVSIWRYDPARTVIQCDDLFILGEAAHRSGAILSAATCPAYFQALTEMDVVAVDDVSRDPRTLELWEPYLRPLGVASLMDSTVRLGGAVDGVLCCEHIGGIRKWAGDETAFAAAMANQVSLAIEANARRQAVEAMISSQTRFNILSRSINDAVYDWDFASDRIWWSDAFAILFGRSEGEETFHTWSARVHPAEREVVIEAFKQNLARGEDAWASEYRLRRADGTYAYVLDRGVVIRDAEGRSVRMLGTVADLTGRRRAEAAVRESEARFRNLAENVNKVFFSFDQETRRVDYINPQFERIWRMERARILDDPLAFLEHVHPADRRMVFRRYRAALSGTSVAMEYRLLFPGGEERWIHGTVYPVMGEGGYPQNLVGTARDITREKRTILQLALTNRALEMLSCCDEVLIRTQDEAVLLAEICRIAVGIGGYMMAWVGYARDDSARSILPMAHAGEENGYLAEIALTWDENEPSGRGPAGRSIRSGTPAICENISSGDPYFYWRPEALRRGFRGVTCLPLRHGEKTFGLLALYSGEVRVVAQEEVRLLKELADNLAYGIVHLRGERERLRIESAVSRMAASVSASGGEAFYGQLVASTVEALGADAGILVGMPAEEPARAIAAFAEGRELAAADLRIADEPWASLLSAPESEVFRTFEEGRLVVAGHGGLVIRLAAGCRLVNSEGVSVGFLLVLFRHAEGLREFIGSTLRIFAARAAAELERQQADRRISEQASLLDKARDAIVVRDLGERVTYWNKSAERLYGWTREEAIGQSVESLLYNEPTAFRAACALLVERGDWQGELTQTTKQGTEVIVEARWTLVRDHAGNPDGILAINTDVTAHRNLERQLQRAQRLEEIGTLAGGIAHDLNNMLTPIIMSVELLRGSVTGSRSTGLLDSIEQSARRGSEMVSHVLSVARGTVGRRIVVDLWEQIQEVGKIAGDTFPQNISIHASAEQTLWPVLGDPTQIHQVLLNLYLNSRDAMPDGGRIEVIAENFHVSPEGAATDLDAVAGNCVRVSVTDTGSGIPAGMLDKIFDPFFTTKEIGRGTGLGLSSLLAIVKGHGGFVQVRSKPGEGTCFLVHLPIATDGAVTGMSLGPDGKLRINGGTILIVDDEAPVRKLTRQVLETFGFRVMEAAGGREAIKVFSARHREIDLVLTDMMMPGMDGAGLIVSLLQIHSAVRVVATSGIPGTRKVARLAGVSAFLQKPYNGADLIKAFEEALADRRV